ncbi:MAG TPA: tetratricopeptide repeat protein [Phycisphaerae bacterium]|nr:tetratricopeptide repeat protein [Phycisphaerae bacterium]
MARRVNTPFVIGLGSVLAVGAVSAALLVGTNILRNKDPHKLEAKGEAAEKKGDVQTAVQYYAMAADAASRKHELDAAQMWERAANTALALSVKETNAEQSEKYYQTARAWWENALRQDPRYLPVLERTLEDDHDLARYYGRSASAWTALDQRATKVIEAQPTYAAAYTYRAEAHLQEAVGVTIPALQAKQLDGAQEDAAKARELDKNAEGPVAVLVRLGLTRSVIAQQRKLKDESARDREAAIKLAKDFLAEHPNSPQVSVVLAQVLVLGGDQAGAIGTLEAAAQKSPGDPGVAGMLADMYQQSDPARAEAVLKAAIPAAADRADAYARLAQFYEDSGRVNDALAAWKDMLAHPTTGGGLAALKENGLEVTALAAVSWLQMNIVEASGMQSEAGKAALAEAKSYAEQLRQSKQAGGLQDMLDGRMELLRLNVPQAITYLQKADATFTIPNKREWLRTKMALAQAYDLQQDWGLELKTVEDVLAVYPTAVNPMLRRAQVLIRLARYNEALGVVKPLADDQRLPVALRQAATGIQAVALSRLGDKQQSTQLLTTMGTPAALLQIARNRLSENDAQGAMDQVDAVLKDSPENLDALYLGVLAAMQANHKDKAADYVARALKKDPANTQFKLLAVAVNDSAADAAAGQMKVLQAISDPVMRNLSIAQFYGRQGDLEKQFASLQDAKKAVEAAGDSAPAGAMNDVVDRLFVTSLQLADRAKDSAGKEKYWAQAATYVQEAERLNLDGVKGQLYQGRLQLARGGAFAQAAVQTLEQAVAARPDTSLGHTCLGEAYASQTPPRRDAALEQFRQAIQQRPDNLAALHDALALLVDKGDQASLAEAKTYYLQGLQFFPRDKGLAAMGDVLGDPAEAIRTREQIRQKDPENMDNLRRLALLYSRQGAPQKAIDVLRPAYDKKPEIIVADFLARMYHQTQQDGEALRLYDPYVQSADAAQKFQGLLMKGEMLRLMGKDADAVDTFKQAMGAEPRGTDEAERRLADYYFDVSQMANAEELYRQIRAGSHASDVKVTYRLAETLVREGKFTDANKILDDDVLSKQPSDAEALVLRSVALLSAGKPNDALKVLNDILNRNASNTDALFYRASALLALNQNLDQAARDLLAVRDAKTGTANTAEAQLNSRLLLARVYRQSRRYSEAAGAYEDAIKQFPAIPSIRADYADYLLWLVGVQQHLTPSDNGSTAFAVKSVGAEDRLKKLLNDSAQAFPDIVIWAVLDGRLSQVKGNVDEARQKLAAAYNASKENPAAASPYLEALINAKAYQEASTLASHLLADKPDFADYYVKRAQAYAGLGKTDLARADFDRALGIVSGDADSYLNIVKLGGAALTPDVMLDIVKARATGRPQEAVAKMGEVAMLIDLQRGAEAVPILTALLADKSAENLHVVAQRSLGLAKYQAKDFKGAYAAYQDVLTDNPNDAETLNNLAYMLTEDMNRPQDAMLFARRAVQALAEGSPEGIVLSQGSVLDTYGWAKYRSGDKEGAISELRRAIDADHLPIAYLHLAKVYKDVGRVDEAKRVVGEGLQAVAAANDPAVAELQGLQKQLGS